MCTFVLGTLPTSATLNNLERGFFRFRAVNAGRVASVLLPGGSFGRMTSRSCDCGTALGLSASIERTAERERERVEHKLDRLRRKGWSHARIERWLAQAEADHDRSAIATADGAANEAREWHGWLHHALEEIRTNYVGLLVDDFQGMLDHAYGGGEKPVPLVRDLRLPEVDETFLGCMAKNARHRLRSAVAAEPNPGQLFLRPAKNFMR